MALKSCPECGKQISDTTLSCPHCGFSGGTAIGSEEMIFEGHPSLGRTRPFGVLLCVLLIILGPVILFAGPKAYVPWGSYLGLFLLGLGALTLFSWWVKTRSLTLTVTNRHTTMTEGLISRNTTQIMHAHIRGIRVQQSLTDRIFNVGRLSISSSAQSATEIDFPGLAAPNDVKEMIEHNQRL